MSRDLSGLINPYIFLDTEIVSRGKTLINGCMAKAQHAPAYKHLPVFLKTMRKAADLTQRQLGVRLKKPQSWIFNCETGNRRVDVAEFIRWCEACDVDAEKAFTQFKRRS